jgi:hypothetical protein
MCRWARSSGRWAEVYVDAAKVKKSNEALG